ncbi:hypothetical protein Pint_13952 [Pistacia integerrima]|uniref:Uncharacterized protein n=1 Tax=Pistacia integerrima TaxID=434235 RepID=A0ACC0YA05_9ROSI|nr:hypothetical protein Pint_13952 [Pistacia integerrima]
MNFTTSFHGNLSLLPVWFLLPCLSSAIFSFFTCSSCGTLSFCKFFSGKKKEIVCRVTGIDRKPDSNNDKEKKINEDGENPPATDTHQKNDKRELDSKLDDVNQITSNDVETNGLGGGVQVMEAAQASARLSDWWVLDKKLGHVVVFALCRLSRCIGCSLFMQFPGVLGNMCRVFGPLGMSKVLACVKGIVYVVSRSVGQYVQGGVCLN